MYLIDFDIIEFQLIDLDSRKLDNVSMNSTNQKRSIIIVIILY